MKHLAFEDASLLPSPREAMPMWCALGLRADLLDEVVEKWRMLWWQGQLLIDQRFSQDPTIYGKVAAASMALHHPAYSKSRWLTVGRACRSLCCSLLFGLESLVESILSQKGKDFPLGGCSQLPKNSNNEFCLIAGLTGYVSDSVLEYILEDPRAGQQLEAWEQAGKEDIELVASWGMPVWKALVDRGLAPSLAPRALHDKVMHGCWASYGFMHNEAFKVAAGLPWSLARWGHGCQPPRTSAGP